MWKSQVYGIDMMRSNSIYHVLQCDLLQLRVHLWKERSLSFAEKLYMDCSICIAMDACTVTSRYDLYHSTRWEYLNRSFHSVADAGLYSDKHVFLWYFCIFHFRLSWSLMQVYDLYIAGSKYTAYRWRWRKTGWVCLYFDAFNYSLFIVQFTHMPDWWQRTVSQSVTCIALLWHIIIMQLVCSLVQLDV